MPASIADTLQQAVAKLSDSFTPLLDAEILLSEILAKSRSYLKTHPEMFLNEEECLRFSSWLERRIAGEPVAYITGRKEFWSLNLWITTNTLIPRPETELLVEAILARMGTMRKKILDLGTGSGAIALALASERPEWKIIATDICPQALVVAQKNASRLKLSNVDFCLGDWFRALPFIEVEKYDAILSNPPYLSTAEWPHYAKSLQYEPQSALVAGEQGLEALNTIIKTAKHFLKPSGWIALEHGFEQGECVRQLLNAEGYENIQTLKDFQSIGRVSLALQPAAA